MTGLITDPDAAFTRTLEALGFTGRHAWAMEALMLSPAEREEIALHLARQFSRLRPGQTVHPVTQWWRDVIADALARRFPGAAEEPRRLASEALILLAQAWQPETLPPAAPHPPALFTGTAAGGDRPSH